MLDHRVGLKLGVAYQGIHSQSPHAVATDEQTGVLLRTAFDVCDAFTVLEQILRHRFQVAVKFAGEGLSADAESAAQLGGGEGNQITVGLPRRRGVARSSDEQAQLARAIGSSLTGID